MDVSIWGYAAIAAVIAILWLTAGSREYKPPQALVSVIGKLRQKIMDTNSAPVMTLNIEAREFCHDDIEKEIYIIRKSRNQNPADVHFNVMIQTRAETMDQQERDKTVRRLENRFPGINVQFLAEGPDAE